MEESKTIAGFIQNNTTLFGFHFQGNYGYVDRKGFLKIPEDFRKENILHLQHIRRIQGLIKYNFYFF